jgi:hypothetical protein
MWQHLEQKILQVNKVTGIEVTFSPDNRYLIDGIVISNKKNRIVKEDEFTGITQVSELVKKADPKIPVSIVFNGKGILVKKIPGGETLNNPLMAVLPNANPADFYFETQQYSGFSVAAISRKEIIESFIQLLKNAGFTVLQASLGFNTISHVLSFINLDDKLPLITNLYSLQADAGKNIIGYEVKETQDADQLRITEYAIGNQYIRAAHILAFSAAVYILTDNLKNTPILQSATLTHDRTEFRYQNLFKFAGMALLSFIFIVLLLNFFIYSHYFNKNKELHVTHVFSKEKQEQTAVIAARIKNKEEFLLRSGWHKPCKASFYADRIASLTPFNTLLTSMAIYPVKSNVSGEFPVMNFKTDTIAVTGTCENPVDINQFMNNLKIIEQFKTVTLKNYLYKKEKETATFSLEIITR